MSTLRPLDRCEASEYLLTKHGVRLAPGTLAKFACIGGGPPYKLAGKRAVYDPPDLDQYARDITTSAAGNSQAHAPQRARIAKRRAPTRKPNDTPRPVPQAVRRGAR